MAVIANGMGGIRANPFFYTRRLFPLVGFADQGNRGGSDAGSLTYMLTGPATENSSQSSWTITRQTTSRENQGSVCPVRSCIW